MKKTFLLSLLIMPLAMESNAAIDWWERETVCRINPSKCYNTMGAGFDIEAWDSDSECRGKKIICGTALKPTSDENWALSKLDVRNMNGINPDFNIDILNGDCFGVRQTISNGLQAIYNDKPVDVYCPGILENIYDYDYIENVETGSILARATQPKCDDLAEYGYARVKNGRCYGKRYSESEYYIDCSRGDDNDARLIILNGADYREPMGNNPHTPDAAEEKFQEMIELAKKLRG